MATTKYNRRAIMLAAWTIKRIYGEYRTFGQCLKEAWAKAKKAATPKAPVKTMQERVREMLAQQSKMNAERRANETVRTYSEAEQKSLIDYYANNRYNGD